MPHLNSFPGFVDLQVNGYLGVDFSHPEVSEGEVARACRAMLAAGTAAFLPTLITCPLEGYQRNLGLLARVLAREEFAGRLLGIHLEGPFISSREGAVGAHNPEWTRQPDPLLFERMQTWAEGRIRMLTLAPELEGAERLAQHAAAQGVIVALGHTLASADDLARLRQCGARALTHLGNGLPMLLPKFANPLWAGLADESYTATMIGDGHHVPPAILRAMIRAKGVEQTIIVSDAAPVAGLPPGEYLTLGNRAVLEPSGRLHNPAKGHLVGSSYTLLECMNVLAGLGCFSLEDLLTMGRGNALKLLGMEEKRLGQAETVTFDAASRRFGVAGEA
jgi:N-acetylglucosamine-6-phosphate deacetylase